MSRRRCKPGIRARLICQGPNRGKIVLVVRRHFGELVDGIDWVSTFYPWVVASLGAPFQSKYVDTGEAAPPSMTLVVDDCELEPLRDDDGQEGTNEGVPSTIKRETVIAGRS